MPASLPADYHMHTPLCRHASGTPEAFVTHALSLGLPEIGFSDHSPMPQPFDDWRMLAEELPQYFAWIDQARAAAANRIPVRMGLEVDWIDGGSAWIHELAAMAPWDYFIGGVHYLGSWNFDNPSLTSGFSSLGIEASWDRYWQLFADAARSGCFDIMAHPDLIKKFGHRPTGDLDRWYVPAITALADSGVAIEINTAGLFKDVAEMYPAPRFLELARAAAANRIPVRMGLEVDWFDGGTPWIHELAEMAPWDYFIGGVHYLGSWNFDNPALVTGFSSLGIEASWDRYWQLFADAARSGCFDIMAHPDLIKKFGHRPSGDLDRWYVPAITALADSGVAIEINTAGLFKDVAEMYPAPRFLELARAADIPLTINSDAHAPEECGRAFSAAVSLAKAAGYTELARFSARKRTSVPLV